MFPQNKSGFFLGRVTMRDNLRVWVPVVYIVLLFGCWVFLMTGCTAHIELKTHAQQWETQKDRYSMNRSADEVTVKSLKQYRDEYKSDKFAGK